MASTKNDMNRLGLFQEMKYISIQDPYKPSSKFGFNEAAHKGKQVCWSKYSIRFSNPARLLY